MNVQDRSDSFSSGQSGKGSKKPGAKKSNHKQEDEEVSVVFYEEKTCRKSTEYHQVINFCSHKFLQNLFSPVTSESKKINSTKFGSILFFTRNPVNYKEFVQNADVNRKIKFQEIQIF